MTDLDIMTKISNQTLEATVLKDHLTREKKISKMTRKKNLLQKIPTQIKLTI
jgi:hypothetical protein